MTQSASGGFCVGSSSLFPEHWDSIEWRTSSQNCIIDCAINAAEVSVKAVETTSVLGISFMLLFPKSGWNFSSLRAWGANCVCGNCAGADTGMIPTCVCLRQCVSSEKILCVRSKRTQILYI